MVTYRVRLIDEDHNVVFEKEYKTQRNAWKRYVSLRENLQKDAELYYIRLESNEAVAVLIHSNGVETANY